MPTFGQGSVQGTGGSPPVALPRFSVERVAEGLSPTSSQKAVKAPLLSQQQMGHNQQHLASSDGWLKDV